MPFIEEILRHQSLSIVGLEKNTGKTVCLNYVLRRLHECGIPAAVTSIGVDGEQTDSVYATAKPEITIYPKMQFLTSAKHYLQRRLISEIIAVDEQSTSLGQLVRARAVSQGKVLLSGAATTEKLTQQIAELVQERVPITIVDGALSRLSLASPTVTDAMILATGAAVSPNLQQLISKTRFYYQLINLQQFSTNSVNSKAKTHCDTPTIGLPQQLETLGSGIWAIDCEGQIHDLQIASVFLITQNGKNLFRYGHTLYVTGAVSDRLLKQLTAQSKNEETLLIVRDFTKLFITPEVYHDFCRHGGRIEVLQQSKLIAICLNPTSPQGYRLDSKNACNALSDALGIKVYDVMEEGLHSNHNPQHP